MNDAEWAHIWVRRWDGGSVIEWRAKLVTVVGPDDVSEPMLVCWVDSRPDAPDPGTFEWVGIHDVRLVLAETP